MTVLVRQNLVMSPRTIKTITVNMTATPTKPIETAEGLLSAALLFLRHVDDNFDLSMERAFWILTFSATMIISFSSFVRLPLKKFNQNICLSTQIHEHAMCDVFSLPISCRVVAMVVILSLVFTKINIKTLQTWKIKVN